MYVCDCGQQYADLNGIEACQKGNHGNGVACPNCDELLKAAQAVIDAREELETAEQAGGANEAHFNNAALAEQMLRAAIAKATGN